LKQWRRRQETEELLATSDEIRLALLATSARLDRFVTALQEEVERLRGEDGITGDIK